MTLDPTTLALETEIAERRQLREEIVRLRALVEEACGELEDTGGEFAKNAAKRIRQRLGRSA